MDKLKQTARIQIVEDEFIIAGEIRRILENSGNIVTSIVNSGEAAVEKAQADAPDIILMDINLQGRMDGIEAAQIIHNQFDIPIIFVTAYTDNEKIERAKQAMPLGYILKPFRDQDIKVAVEMALYVAAANKKVFESERRLSQAERIAGLGSWEMDVQTGNCKWSDELYRICGYAPGSIEPTLELFFSIIHPEDRQEVNEYFDATIKNGVDYSIEQRIIRADGEVRFVHAVVQAVYGTDNRPQKMIGTLQDITEKKRLEEENRLNNMRLEIIHGIATLKDADEKNISDLILERMLGLSGSGIGFLGFLNDTEDTMMIHSWSKSAMAQCRILDKPMHFPIAEAGLWGEPVRKRKPMIINDYGAVIESKKGYPQGHVPVTRFMCIPVFDNLKIVAVAAVGNKALPYTNIDVDQLQFLMQGAWEQIRRRRQDLLLAEKERRFRRIIDTSGAGYFFIDLDGCFREVNDTWLKMHGFKSRDQIIGRHFTITQTSQNLSEAERVVKQVVDHGFIQSGESSRRNNDGSTGYHTYTVSPVYRSDELVGLEGFIIDTTERKLAEEALRKRDALLANIASQVPGMLYQFKMAPDGTFSVPYSSQGVRNIFGCSPEDVRNDFGPIFNAIHFEDRDKILQTIDESARQMSQWRCEYRVQVSDKPIKWIFGNSIPEKKPDGSIVWSGYNVDITERKQAETALRESEEQFRHFFEHLTIGVAVYEAVEDGQDFVFYDMNPAGQELSRISIEDIRGEKLTKIFPGVRDLGLFQALQETWRTGKPIRVPFGQYTDERISQWVENQVFRVPSGRVVAVYDDRTVLMRLEERLRQAQKMESIGTLAGGIAHDFNNILYPIIGHAEMLMDDLPPNSLYQNGVRAIFNSALRASELVKQILAFSRQSNPVLKAVRVQSIIGEIMTLIKHSLPSTIHVKTNINTSVRSVIADETQLQQVIMNLVTNAFQAMQDDGGTLGIVLDEVLLKEPDSVNLSLSPGEYLCLSITDTGSGIEQGIIGRIFDPYFTTKEKGKGTGLGLAMTHGIIKSYGGDIKVNSEPGKGSMFQVYIPILKVGTTNPEESGKTETGLETVKCGTERILFVDDEVFIVDAAFLMLSRLGYLVTTRTNSIEALTLFKRLPDKFDLIITDMTMPDMTGIQLTKEVRRIRPDIPIILCTGFSEQIDEQKAKSMGIDALAMKPIAKEQMSKIIRKVLGDA